MNDRQVNQMAADEKRQYGLDIGESAQVSACAVMVAASVATMAFIGTHVTRPEQEFKVLGIGVTVVALSLILAVYLYGRLYLFQREHRSAYVEGKRWLGNLSAVERSCWNPMLVTGADEPTERRRRELR